MSNISFKDNCYQIKNCYRNLQSKHLITLFNKILFISKKVRTQSKIKRYSTCISSIAVKYIYQNYYRNQNQNVSISIIGNGNIGKKVYKKIMLRNMFLSKLHIFDSKNISNFNISYYDIIFTASSNKLHFLNLKKTKNNTIIVDMGFPSNLDTSITIKDYSNRKYYNLTFFENISRKNKFLIQKMSQNITTMISKYL